MLRNVLWQLDHDSMQHRYDNLLNTAQLEVGAEMSMSTVIHGSYIS